MSTHDAIFAGEKRTRIVLFSLGVILIGANLRAAITAIGPVLPSIQQSLELSESQAGVLNALPLLIFAIFSLIAPTLGKKFGLERVLAAALLAIAAGTLVRSSGPHVAVWAGTLLLSLGIAFGNVLLPGLAKREMGAQAPTLIALYASAMAGFAGLAAGVAVPIAMLPGSSWRWSLGGWALLAIIGLIAWLPQMRRAQPQVLPGVRLTRVAMSPWKHPTGWAVSLFFALHSAIFYSTVSWYPSYAATTGLSLRAAGVNLLVYQIVAVASNIVCGPLIKRSKNQVALGVLCGALLVTGTGGLFLRLPWQVVWIAVSGLGAGIAMTTSLTLFGLRTVDHDQASHLSGMAQFIGYLGGASGPLLVGVLQQITGGWTAPMLMLCMVSFCVIFFAAMAGRDTKIS
jgi:MFS transporter, CP family, cyanate transporter